jgi:colicin import membrane protein
MQAQKLKSIDWLQSALVHGALLLGLVISVQWKSKPPESEPVQVELFSPPPAVTRTAPPPAVQVTPLPVKPVPTPLPETKVDIAIEKKAAEVKKAKAEEKLKEDKLKEDRLKDDKLKAEKLERAATEKAAKDKALKDKTAQEKIASDRAVQAAQEKIAAEKAEEKSRDDALKKIIASAGSPSGNTSDKNAEKTGAAGNALSAGDITRLQNMIRSNTVFQIPESMKGNPEAEFVVNLMPDCTVVGVKLKKSSGLSNWDDAAERAISRIKQFPRPASGTCASSYAVTHKPLS